MDKTKTFAIIVAAVLLVTALYPGSARSQIIREWESIMSYGGVQDMLVYNGEIWAATTGGLIQIDPRTMSYKTYTNVDGLQTNRINSLCIDDRNRLWVGGRGRLIDFTDPANPDGYLFTDNEGLAVEIYDIACTPGGDSLWLANQLGVTLFLASDEKGDGLILDTYTRLGGIERDTPVRRVVLDSDSVWVGTDRGLAVGPRADVTQLKTPLTWHSYAISEMTAAPSDLVNGLIILDDTVFVGTVAGVYRFDTNPEPALINIGLFNDPYIFNISLQGDTILVHSDRGTTSIINGNALELPFAGMPIRHSTAGVYDDNGSYWNGNLSYGVFRLEGSEMIAFEVGGMPSNECRKIVETQGKIWGAFWTSGLAYFENNRWQVVPEVEGAVKTLAVGPLGELWVGTWGRGVYRLDDDTIIHFDATNSALSGLFDAPGYIVISDIYYDDGAVWFANLLGRDGELVAVNPYNTDQWTAYVLSGGFFAEWLETVTAGQGVVYAGSRDNGIFALSYQSTPFFPDDDFWMILNSDSAGIGSDVIKYMRVDSFDTLWVGTAFGLSYQSLGEIFFRNIDVPVGFGPEVRTIDFDGQGSLYAGSERGMIIRDIATGSFEHLTSANSGLVDDRINDIFYQAQDNAFWIATSGGVSRMTLPAGLVSSDIDEVLTYPNPFVIRRGNETIRFNYTGTAEIRIFTLAGEMVREIPINGVWDGDNQRGEPVASGVYLFTLTDRDGEVGRGKLLLIRE